jgi:hypothetical protein
MMNYVYLDWNVFDRIEKAGNLPPSDRETFEQIESLITNNSIITPYSNAHINDLIRGYNNNPTFISKHLETLKRLTNNLCIVQYWGHSNTTWHFRDVEDFFYSALEDIETTPKSFKDLMNQTELSESRFEALRLTPIPPNIKDSYKAYPIFSAMFPRTMTEMNLLAMCEDLFEFYQTIKKDYILFKSLRTFVNESRAELKKQENIFRGIDELTSGIPTHLSFDDAWEQYLPKTKTSDNPVYQKITNTYCKIDFKGFKSDEKFSNLIDDSLHVFYGAQCDFFITIDNKCRYKAIETYNQLEINTKVLEPKEYLETILTGLT